MAITIVFAPPRTGKTAFVTHCLNQALYNRPQYLQTKAELENKNANGFKYTIPPRPVVCANYHVKGSKFGYRSRKVRRINPFRLGYANPFVKVHFVEPFAVIGITEGQKYFNSRMSKLYPDWQSRWMEQHGHDGYEIIIDVQRPMLIDVNIRELADFIEIIKKESKQTRNGTQTIWTIRRIPGNAELDRYLASGKKDTTCYTEDIIIADYDVHRCYDHKLCKPKFFEGHLKSDFDTIESEPLEETMEGYIKYLKKYDDELPPNFYKKGAA